jgi:hypothetical protein
MPANEDVPIATAVCVEAVSFKKGQSVTLMNMSSNPDMNGVSAVVVNDIGGRVIIEVPSLSKKITVKPENLQLSYTPFPVGSVVELKGLFKKEMNGLLAKVVDGNVNYNGRLAVELLDEESRILHVKPDNLESIEEFY